MAHFEILIDGEDVTASVTSVQVEQPAETIYRTFRLDLVGAHNIGVDSRVDIYYNAAGGDRETLVIRQGLLAPTWSQILKVGRVRSSGEAITPSVTLEGFDGVYLATRRAPLATVVLASDRQLAAKAVKGANGPVGRWRFVRARTLHDAVRWLAGAAGLRIELGAIPNHPFSARVLEPLGAGRQPASGSSSYWSHLFDLLEPWAPDIYYRRESNTVVIVDRLSPRVSGNPFVTQLPQDLISNLTGRPRRRRHVRRVVAEVASHA